MGCSNCSTSKDGKPGGCKSNGSCSTGGCNRLNTYDWLSTMDLHDPGGNDLVEVSFKNGARKTFFHNALHTRSSSGDMVVVETGAGHDIGRISLSGELVRLQMKKKKVAEDSVFHKVIRKANERDLERMEEARKQEKKSLVQARVISRTLGLEMKIGDVEYQADKRKATFFYTADGRVDFRELIRMYAKEFRVKIEMRQIGARQESARIGGIGSCGRELCCSTWLSEFKSVSTGAARYQNLAINQTKLSGQCGRLKCCLNFELDTYMDALTAFPKNVDTLKTEVGIAQLVKTDIFKGILYYIYRSINGKQGGGGKFYPLSIDRVKAIKAMNKEGKFPEDLQDMEQILADARSKEVDFDEDLTGFIELPPEERKKRNRKRRNRNNKDKDPRAKKTGAAKKEGGSSKKRIEKKPRKEGEGDKKPGDKKPNNKTSSNKSRNRRRPNRRKPDGAKRPDKPNNENKPNKDNKGGAKKPD